MKFGVDLRKSLTGAELSVRIQQICALLPVLYLFAGSGFGGVINRRSVLSLLFDLGISSLPRAESLLLSLLYRLSRSEVLVNFVVLGFALLLGLVAAPLLRGSRKRGRITRWVLAGLAVADLLLRLLPFSFNRSFGTVPALVGFAVQALCLALVLLDLRADGKSPDA